MATAEVLTPKLEIESTQTQWGPYIVEAATTSAPDHPNQDGYYPQPSDPLPSQDLLHGGYMCVLADGATRCLNGKLAAETAIQQVPRQYYGAIPDSDDFVTADIDDGLARALLNANQQLINKSAEARKALGIDEKDIYQYLQTTCLAVVLHKEEAYLARVGNSSAFIFDPATGRVESIFGSPPTIVDKGKNRHLLLGTNLLTSDFIERRVIDLTGGKILLLATDGVEYFCKSNDPEVIAAQIEDKIRRNPGRQINDLLVEIIRTARSNFGAYGKGDDVTVMAISVAEEPSAPEATAAGKAELEAKIHLVAFLVLLANKSSQEIGVEPEEAGAVVEKLLVSLARLSPDQRRNFSRNRYDGEPDFRIALARLNAFVLDTAVRLKVRLGDVPSEREAARLADFHPGRTAEMAIKELVILCSQPGFRLEYDYKAFKRAFSRLIEALHRMTPAERDRLAGAWGRENIGQLYADLVATVIGE